MKAPTLADVARRAGVSYATADRVVNARGGVADARADRVRQAIADLGYVRNVAAANLSQGRVYRFVFVIPTGTNAFFLHLRMILGAVAPRLRLEKTELRIEDVAAFDAPSLVAVLRALALSPPDGIALVGIDSPEVAAAVAELTAAGVAVVTLVSDMPDSARHAYVGIDNSSAGRTAARLMGLAHARGPGRVLPVLGSLTARDHRERLAGFRAILAQDFPQIALLPEFEGRDRAELVEQALERLFDRGEAISGIYSLGAGNSGLARALARFEGTDRRPVVIVHELTPRTREALGSGNFDVVIDQRPGAEIALALATMRQISDRLPAAPIRPIIPAIIFQDNMPEPEDSALLEAAGLDHTTAPSGRQGGLT